ncbi:MAG: NAD(P)H-hydrate dehydratase [Clostridia bacterium]|nr:NAD(P)H-hydrate dehydratase [Clostridia bacterium]
MTDYNGIENVKVFEASDVKLPDRDTVTNKGDCGRLLVFGGDRGMAGAAYFSAESAYRSGTGLVEILTHPDNRIPIQTLIPEAIASFWDQWDAKRINSYSALTVGVGLGKSDIARKLLYRILSVVRKPTVIDADALNIISDTHELLGFLGTHTVLTPHLLEFSRLTGVSVDGISKDTFAYAQDFAKRYNTNLVLKDKISVIALANGETFANVTGDSTLSKGGSGDVLAGLIGSLLAQGMPMERAVPTAVFLHGRAGEQAGKRWGVRGALARDLLKELALTIKDF